MHSLARYRALAILSVSPRGRAVRVGMLSQGRLLLHLLLLAAAIPGTCWAACSSGADCSLNGVCSPSGSCGCDPGWEGPSCAQLKIAPAPPGGIYGFGVPFATTSWGGNAIWDNQTAQWHLFVTEIGGANCGLHGWSGGSTVAHATSKTILGPYSKQDIALTHEAHNPQTIQLADGKWYIWHIGTANGRGSPKACNESGSGQPPVAVEAEGRGSKSALVYPRAGARPPPPPPAAAAAVGGSTVHTAASPAGPWSPVQMLLAPAAHCNNPSPFLHPNGTLYLACTWTLRRSLSGAAAGPWSDSWPIVTTKPLGTAAAAAARSGGGGGGVMGNASVSGGRPLGTWEECVISAIYPPPPFLLRSSCCCSSSC
jgi:hypothetical protein